MVPLPTPRRTRGLSVTPQIDEPSLAQSNASVSVVHLDNHDVVSSGTGEVLSDELVGHGSGIETGDSSDDRGSWPVQAPQAQILVVTLVVSFFFNEMLSLKSFFMVSSI